MKKGLERKPRSSHPREQQLATTSKGGDCFGKNLFTTFADLHTIYGIALHNYS